MTGPAIALLSVAPPAAPGLVVALVLLGIAQLVAGGRPGRGRLRDLRRRQHGDPQPGDAGHGGAGHGGAAEPVVRRHWIVVGTLAVGAVTVAGLGWTASGAAAAVVAGGGTAVVASLAARAGTARQGRAEFSGGELAGCWELLAVCLQTGLPVAAALSAATEGLTGRAGGELRRVAGLLALGADPAEAWASTRDVPTLAAFARAAERSAGTGAALAHVARGEAERLRAELLDTAQARAQRAAVMIAGPLGLCFLPAFLVLGIAPVVVGLAREALAQW